MQASNFRFGGSPIELSQFRCVSNKGLYHLWLISARLSPHSSSRIFCWLSVLCSLEYPKFLENSWVGGMSWSGWGMWGSQMAGKLPASWQKREPVRGATSWPRATPKRKHRRPWQVGESSSGTMSVVLSMVLRVLQAVLMAKMNFF